MPISVKYELTSDFAGHDGTTVVSNLNGGFASWGSGISRTKTSNTLLVVNTGVWGRGNSQGGGSKAKEGGSSSDCLEKHLVFELMMSPLQRAIAWPFIFEQLEIQCIRQGDRNELYKVLFMFGTARF